MDKDLILNITNEAIKGKSPKRSILDIYSFKGDKSLEPIINKYIKNEANGDNIISFINRLSESTRDVSDIITIVSDIIEIDYLKKRLDGMIKSYRKKGLILLLILYIVFPFITSTLSIITGLQINTPLPLNIGREEDKSNINRVDILIYTFFLESMATIYICRQFNLNTRKLFILQTILFVTIYVFIGNWAAALGPIDKRHNI